MSNFIVMAFSPLNIVGRLLKKSLTKASGIFQSAQGCQSCAVGMERCCALSKKYIFWPPLSEFAGSVPETNGVPVELW